ncbi:helical backbone metal receptor [Nocardioides pocheonensis]|uniref:helical backbone metal receptor n=1 Tax=Nocardioides pocheonensis TaxID=661485 RepID=UPI003CCC4F5C
MRDDLDHPVDLPDPPRRLVSLVPSLTEAVAGTGLLVGATDWCTHPADLEVTRVRGTKNPNVKAIVDLRPDLVLANKEENRELDVRRLREAGVPVWVTDIETVPQSLRSLERIFTEALRRDVPAWLVEADRSWSGPIPPPVARVAVPIWRDPWMVVGSHTFTGDLVARLGLHNVFADPEHNPGGERYPHVDLAELDRDDVDLVLLPDEPYVFTAEDGPEAFTRTPVRLVSGRLLTWYGPSLIEARELVLR